MMRELRQAPPDASMHRNGPACGERELMRAVLEDAIRCLAGEIGPTRERPQLAAQAREWVAVRDARWPFSFDNICDGVGLDVGSLRERLLRNAPVIPFADGQPTAVRRTKRDRPAEDDIVKMIRSGQPLRVVAETFGISVSKVSILSCGLASRLKAERDDEIRSLRQTGWTHRALAAHFGLSRIRILRICARREEREEDSRTAA
jgi:hypothetical protein